MEKISKHPMASDLYKRNEIIIDDSKDEGDTLLRLMHWNVLADCLHDAFPFVHKSYLSAEYRIPLIVQEIQETAVIINEKLTLPHVICCQEMDMQDEILKRLNEINDEEYAPFNYEFELISKPGDHNDGLCIFYNTKVVNILNLKKDTYSGLDGQQKTNRVYMVILFQHKESGKKFVIGTVHLKAKKPFFEERYLEIQEYFIRFKEFIEDCIQKENLDEGEFDSIPCIITGDFNDNPDSKAVLAIQNTEISNSLEFKSSYCIDGKYPDFSTYKYRGEKPDKHVIDYIFYSENKRMNSIKLQSIREIPGEDEIIPGVALPCHRYPSDHFSLATTFNLK